MFAYRGVSSAKQSISSLLLLTCASGILLFPAEVFAQTVQGSVPAGSATSIEIDRDDCTLATAGTANSLAIGCGSDAGDRSVAIGTGGATSGAEAGTNGVAIGFSSSALTEGSIAIGNDSTVLGGQSIAIGKGATADVTNSVALGTGASSTGSSVAIGGGTVTNNSRNTAVGAGASTTGNNSMALGQGATAGFTNSVAFGAGAQTDSTNQMVFGAATGGLYSATERFTFVNLQNITGTGSDLIATVDPATGDLRSVASIGTTQITDGAVTNAKLADDSVSTSKIQNSAVTTDKINDGAVTNAKLADDSVSTSKIQNGAVTTEKININNNLSANGNRITNLGAPIAATDAATKGYVDAGLAENAEQINKAFRKIDENTEGIAVAIAMGGLQLPQGKNFAMSANVGFYEDKQAFAGQAAFRIDDNLSLHGGVGVGFDEGKVGGRVGLMAAW